MCTTILRVSAAGQQQAVLPTIATELPPNAGADFVFVMHRPILQKTV